MAERLEAGRSSSGVDQPRERDGETSTSGEGEAWLRNLACVQSRVSSATLAFLRECRTLEKRVPPKAFDLKDVPGAMPYVPGAVVGRERRRVIVNRLTSQHAVCLLMKVLGRTELIPADEAFRKLGTKKGQAIWKWAKTKAVEQEQAVFGPVKGPSATMYAAKAGKLGALDYWAVKFDEVDEDDGADDMNGTITKKRTRETNDASDANKATPAPLEEWELDFAAIRASRKAGMHRKLKPVIMQLIDGDEHLASLGSEAKLRLLRAVQATCERDVDPARTRWLGDEKLASLLGPIISENVTSLNSE